MSETPKEIWAWRSSDRLTGELQDGGGWLIEGDGLEGDEAHYTRTDTIPTWQPIETAPKDGTRFVGFSKTHGQHECFIPRNVAHYKRVTAIYGARTSNSNSVWFSPTHWKPLGPAPEES